VSGPKSGGSVSQPATAQANGSQGGGPSALHPAVRFFRFAPKFSPCSISFNIEKHVLSS
jgi:hypothetical protein